MSTVLEVRWKSKVYKFAAGPNWHWKCQGYSCREGGRSKVWADAYAKAFSHARTHIYTISDATPYA